MNDEYTTGYQHGYEDATADSKAIRGPDAYVRIWIDKDGSITSDWKGGDGQLREMADLIEDVAYQILEELNEDDVD